MVTRAQIVEEARSWLGTRYQHQAHLKGVATDCGGLVYGVGHAVGLFPVVEELPDYPSFTGYARLAQGGSLTRACGLLLETIQKHEAQPGDVILMQFNNEPQHTAILGNYLYGGWSLIHAYAPARRVIETRFDDELMSRSVGWYRYSGVTE